MTVLVMMGVIIVGDMGVVKNCYNCKHCWYYEKESYESNVSEGWVCDGRTGNVANLKSFPFKKEQKCFEPKDKK